MIRPDLEKVPPFYKGYVELVKNHDLYEILKDSSESILHVLRDIPEEMGNFRYDTGKWSIKELICHMLDAERIFAYRALRFARNDKTPLAGFEEMEYAGQANAAGRSIEQLTEEMEKLRSTTYDLFLSFTPEMLLRTGPANKTEISVLNLGFIIPGHESHHRNILIERYLSK